MSGQDRQGRALDVSGIALLVLAGGKSSRMGQDKRWVEVGGKGLLEGLLAKAAKEPFAERFLCVEEASPRLRALAGQYGARLLADDARGLGPMAGLARGLGAMRSDWCLALACDMPFFEFRDAMPLLAALSHEGPCRENIPSEPPLAEGTGAREACAILPRAAGRLQPLAAFYRRAMGDALGQALARGCRSLRQALEHVPHRIVELPAKEAAFFNVNSPAELRLARGRAANLARAVPAITVAAPAAGTGKTTFIERLLPRLGAHGIRVGVAKSDAHGFRLDTEGKDSWRFRQAGARGVALVAPDGWMLLQRTEGRAGLEEVAAKMEGVDLLLAESRAHGPRPILSLWRGMGEPIAGEGVAALFAKGAFAKGQGCAGTALPPLGIGREELLQCSLDDMAQAERICLFLMGRQSD